MNIETIPIIEVVPYDKNPRKNDKAVDIVAKSIKEFGFRWPILLDKDNVIIAGHTRLKAAQKSNRACYMMEIDPLYCSVIIERWENLTGKKATKHTNDTT